MISETYDPAMRITDQTEADNYFEWLVQQRISSGLTRAEAETVERQNLGYYAGYYDHATRLRVEELFRCEHPLLPPAREGEPTTEQCLAVGLNLARRLY